jgi:hypothetical protein
MLSIAAAKQGLLEGELLSAGLLSGPKAGAAILF